MYEVSYQEDGTIEKVVPKYEDVPAKVKRQVVVDFENVSYPMKPVVPYIRATQDRVCLESCVAVSVAVGSVRRE